MKTTNNKKSKVNHTFFPFLSALGCGFIIVFICNMCLAGSSEPDVLRGTTGQVLATVDGSGRHWAYLVDLVVGIGTFIKSRNIFVFFSVIAIAIAITVVCGLARG